MHICTSVIRLFISSLQAADQRTCPAPAVSSFQWSPLMRTVLD
jgi:hypothetical protein